MTAAEAAALTEAAAAAGYPHCGRKCDGKDPTSYLIYNPGTPDPYAYCSDGAVTVRTRNSGSTDLDLRYSPRCRTAWTRLDYDFYYPEIRSYYRSGRLRTSYEGFVGRYYTVMVDDAGLLAEACAWAGPGGFCTTRYQFPHAKDG